MRKTYYTDSDAYNTYYDDVVIYHGGSTIHINQ